MPFWIPLALAAGSAIGGALANKKKDTASTLPQTVPEYQPLQDVILKQIMGRLTNPGGLPQSYAAEGVQGINHTYDLVSQGLSNNLTSRGLSTSPIAGSAIANLERGRAGDINHFQASLPLVARGLQDDDLSRAINVLGLGRGTTSTGTTSSGGGVGGAATNLSQMLGYLYGTGALKLPS